MYRSGPFRSTLMNTSYITALDMCKVCTEAVHSVALCPEKDAQTPKRGNGKEDRNRARGVFQGRRTSRSAGIYIYIHTLAETNIALENMASQKESNLPTIIFIDYINFREGVCIDIQYVLYAHGHGGPLLWFEEGVCSFPSQATLPEELLGSDVVQLVKEQLEAKFGNSTV